MRVWTQPVCSRCNQAGLGAQPGSYDDSRLHASLYKGVDSVRAEGIYAAKVLIASRAGSQFCRAKHSQIRNRAPVPCPSPLSGSGKRLAYPIFTRRLPVTSGPPETSSYQGVRKNEIPWSVAGRSANEPDSVMVRYEPDWMLADPSSKRNWGFTRGCPIGDSKRPA